MLDGECSKGGSTDVRRRRVRRTTSEPMTERSDNRLEQSPSRR